jgi:molybdopterin converting factor small subunit
MPITVRIIVLGHSAAFFPDGKREHSLELPQPVKVAEAIRRLGVDPQLIMRVQRNGIPASMDEEVAEDAEIILISPPAGG